MSTVDDKGDVLKYRTNCSSQCDTTSIDPYLCQFFLKDCADVGQGLHLG